MICKIDLSDRDFFVFYRLEEVAKVDSAARTSPGNPCSSPGARPSPKQDPDESWDFWAERRPEMGQFHPREPSCNITRTDFTLAPYSSANLLECSLGGTRFRYSRFGNFLTVCNTSDSHTLDRNGFFLKVKIAIDNTPNLRDVVFSFD